ncbi:3-methyl-2-oxobutanoate hydroxymethyltransferase [Aspergillus thermomutatus]|uniref:3-methyl-2-oxobutanoate hydroxymethyltransferase n=1 Tax=Aspergillus thermomutatus TaxID=41047 RepID=A0A397HQP0_ASPTH|nr:uncharacterized protein CDV56_108710 [Aspergillus thermomutatus]RHZ65519.1 hypothetical protein CDV56_108710 [Aspergillus thermomutatus]
MLTAHDATSALAADTAGIELILVGDSLSMVSLGLESTIGVTLDTMILHCRSVSRAARSSFIIGDLPFGSYEASPSQAAVSAIRMMKEGRSHGIKLEGGEEMASAIARVSQAGIPVFAHIGLTPQRQHAIGGFRAQGRSSSSALKILQDALAVEKAGAVAVVLEAVPAEIASIITQKLRIPTIGIGSGNGCSGQVLVQSDMIGNSPPDRHIPRFVKQYGNVWEETRDAIRRFRAEVKSREFPDFKHTYLIKSDELNDFKQIAQEEDNEARETEE